MAQLENIRIQRIMEWLISEIERLRSELTDREKSIGMLMTQNSDLIEDKDALQGEVDRLRSYLQKAISTAVAEERAYRDFHRWVLDNLVCSGGPDNSPCRLEQSDDPNEYCLYHKALAIGRTRE